MIFFRRSTNRWFAIITCLLLFAGCAGPDHGKPPSGQEGAVQIINQLGRNSNPNLAYKANLQMLKQLAACPQEAVKILVNEIKPVNIVKLDNPSNNAKLNADAHHVLWCFRALYYLTGHTILAESSYKFTDSELDHNRSGLIIAGGKYAFFVEWMSRGTVYFAPEDAQAAIIQKWKMWAEQNVASYHFPENVNFNNWYFGGPE